MRKIILILTVFLMFSLNVYAEGGNGVSVPTLTSSTPADGDIDVPLDQEITLVFSNNITNASVRENNINCIKLVDSNGNVIDIDVVLADDQIEPDKKRDAVIVPINPLNPNTEYSVVISPELTSKNGIQTGVETIVSFTTQAENVVTTTEDATEDTTVDTTQATDTSSQETVNDTTDEVPETTSTEAETTSNNIYTYVIIVGAAIVLALILIPTLKKKK